ncbi:MAG TPA: S16 family serine protease, partial [Terriglobales bacterium]|nr:S16 family serine protease [Terriglobales bacterium]
ISHIILPRDNEKDLADLPENIRALLEVHTVETMDQVLETALERPIPKLVVEAAVAAEGEAAGETLHQ